MAEPLRRMPGIELHPTLFNTPLIYGPDDHTQALVSVYQDFLAVASKAHLPLLMTAPTWRLDAHRVAGADVPVTINVDAISFLKGLCHGAENDAAVLLGALTGPKNDCYRAEQAPGPEEAAAFHEPQIYELGATSLDFLMAQTLPAIREAIGIAQVMAQTNTPYIISFCVGPDGNVLDGTPLHIAMDLIDQHRLLKRPPVGYFVNCTHPQFLIDAYPEGGLDRLIGIQANGSSKDVRTLDGASETEADPISSWANAMQDLHELHTVPILGGCCGTTTEHLQALANL